MYQETSAGLINSTGYLEIGKKYLEIAHDKLAFLKMGLSEEGFSSKEEVYTEYERAVKSLQEALALVTIDSAEKEDLERLLNTAIFEKDNIDEIIANPEFSLAELTPRKLLFAHKNTQTEFQEVVEYNDLLSQWETATQKGIIEFLKQLKVLENPNRSIMISYAKEELASINSTILKLREIFQVLNIAVAEFEYQSTTNLAEQLSKHTHAIVLATPKYKELAAATAEQENVLKKTLHQFGSQTDFVAKLHVLLCQGGFDDVALKIIAGTYLIRNYIKVFNNQSDLKIKS